MNTITTKATTLQPAIRSPWRSVGSFLAGAALASAVAVAVEVAAGDDLPPVRAGASSADVRALEPSADSGCLVVGGPC